MVKNLRVALEGFGSGWGRLAIKNFIEALAANGLLEDDGTVAWESLPDGPGANKFWTGSKITRADMTAYVFKFWSDLKKDGNLKVNGKKVSFGRLLLQPEMVNERLMQYWACAQGRILSVFELFRRGGDPGMIPYHLKSNKVIRSMMVDCWEKGNDAVEDDESSEDE